MSQNRLSLPELLLDRAELSCTNPVFWIEQLAACFDWDSSANWTASQVRLTRFVERLQRQRIALPREAIEKFVYQGFIRDDHAIHEFLPTARVLGLVAEQNVGFVVPLDARVSAGWHVAPTLPFNVYRLQDFVSRLVTSLGVAAVESLPERLEFRVDTAFRSEKPIEGRSMDVAGLLAVVDAADGHRSPLLQRACAVVEAEPGTGGLRAVGHIEAKLSAFRREYTRGSLLIRNVNCPIAEAFDSGFDVVWTIADFHELGDNLYRSGLLNTLLEAISLDGHQAEVVIERLRALVEHQHRYTEASFLAERITRCCQTSQLPAPLLIKLRTLYEDSLRHTGRYDHALKASTESKEYLQSLGDASSHEVHCNADVNYAAGLFDPHRFEEMCEVLGPWVERIEKDPMFFDARTRVKVLNTFARALVILRRPGWERLFRQSLELQSRTARAEIPRTRNYLIHGLLRFSRAPEAQADLSSEQEFDTNDKMSRWMKQFLRAESERQLHHVWSDKDLEVESDASDNPGHPFGFYFQATARQAGRSVQDAAGRFRRAGDLFRKGITDESGNVLQFLASCMDLGEAAWSEECKHWSDAFHALERIIERDSPASFGEYYHLELARLRQNPQSKESTEQFFSRVPFF